LMDAPPTVTAVRPELLAAVDDVVARAMAKEKEHRFDTCEAVVTAARQALLAGTQPTPAMPAAPAPPLQPTIRGEPSQLPPQQPGPPQQPPVYRPTPTPQPWPSQPPRPARRRTGLFVGIGAAAAVVILVIVLVLTLGGNDGFPPQAKEDFINNFCIPGGDSRAFCQCFIDQLETEMSFEEFQRLNNQFLTTGNFPPEFLNATGACQGL
jgi:hypothetical protein